MTACLTEPTAKLLPPKMFRIEYFSEYTREVNCVQYFSVLLLLCTSLPPGRDTWIRYVLPVLWMTSCFHIMGPLACGIGNIYVSAVLEQVTEFPTY